MAEKADGKRPSPHAGHRERMRNEFLRTGGGGMEDHRLLEMLLFYTIPRGDVNPLAHRLVDEFGSLSGVFHATYEQLVKVPGVGHNTAVLLLLVPAAAAHYMKQTASFDGQIASLWQLQEMLEPYFFGQRDEVAYLVCMDGKSKVLAVKKLGEGIVDAVHVTTRKVVETALACNASRVVLAHNHVSGIAYPSDADVSTTQHLERVLMEAAEITLVDHLVFAGGDMVSMAESGLLRRRK